MSGEVDPGWGKPDDPNGSKLGYLYEDLWRWNRPDSKWVKASLCGHPPFPRLGMVSTLYDLLPECKTREDNNFQKQY
ncbi:hypothetical protein M422DRAFT_263110 [Sphaerobolus stellatus SS14]|uniref:Uncharacterized protein n=1 Tax=Sphaerobolus stellatus (strain SS14) TaxID=990650 RepID=A0A0C9UIQ6_SPHS4|nr:hypothetical protein M422DRAFT_263110 [Sphaerobolus stellatus SS14]